MELSKYGVEELKEKEMVEVDGGGWQTRVIKIAVKIIKKIFKPEPVYAPTRD